MAAVLSHKTVARPCMRVRTARKSVQTRAMLDTQLVITGATATMLSLGRFVFLPFQRRESAKVAALPKTDGASYFDNLQKPASFIKTSNDPAGFNIIDVMAWGSLGHAIGYAILAISSNGYDGPTF